MNSRRLVSNKASKYMRRAVNHFMVHTYTWTDVKGIPVLDVDGNPTFDTWGNQIYTDAVPVTNLPCLLFWQDVYSTSGDGTIVGQEPTLYVPYDNLIAEGDSIQNIATSDGTIILTDATALTVNPMVQMGNSICKIIKFTGFKVVR